MIIVRSQETTGNEMDNDASTLIEVYQQKGFTWRPQKWHNQTITVEII